WPPVSVIVCGVLNTVLEKLMVSAPAVAFAWLTAQRREPTLPSSRTLVTVKAAGTRRCSKASTTRRARFGALRVGWEAVRENRLRIQERSDMGTSGNRTEQGENRPPRGRTHKGQGVKPVPRRAPWARPHRDARRGPRTSSLATALR